MKILSVILFSLPFLLMASGKPRIIKGQVFDYETKKPVSLVSIGSEDRPESEIAVTDLNGNFFVIIPESTKSLFLSHIAYEPVEIQLNGKKNKRLTISLRPKLFFLNEITVKGKAFSTARDIIEKAALNLKENMISMPYTANAHFQSYRLKNGKYVFFAEAMAEHFNDAYSDVGYSHSITRPLEYRISDQDFSFSSVISYKYPSTTGLSYKYHQILLPVIVNKAFTYECTDTLFIRNQKHLLINYKINNKIARKMWNKNHGILFYPKYYQYGKILINLENYVICKIINRGSSSYLGKTNSDFFSIVKFKNADNNYYLAERSATHTYKEKAPDTGNYDSFIKKSKTVFSDFNTSPLTNQQIESRFNCKLKILNYKEKEWHYFIQLPAPEKKISKYNHKYWSSKPKPKSWNDIKSDLKELSGIDIKQQFKKNNEYLISKSKFMKLKKYADKETRKTMSRTYKELSKNSFFND